MPYETSYVAVVGNGTVRSDNAASFSAQELDSALRDTIVVV
jgi:hypothetical protein